MPSLRPLVVFGTRPEAIKMAPIIHECRRTHGIAPIVCVTGQHRELLDQAMQSFELTSDIDLDLMQPGQAPASFLSLCLERLSRTISDVRPDCIVVQGDTMTTLAGALAGFYSRIPVVHVEAGLRTGDLERPWPEEFNRRTVTSAATLHCAPTTSAVDSLLREGVVPNRVRNTGNTVIDALVWTLRRSDESENSLSQTPADPPHALITIHRRETIGTDLEAICQAVAALADRFPWVHFQWPVHRNPLVRSIVETALPKRSNIMLLEPMPYPVFVRSMAGARLLLTDSGGAQEEATYLGTPTLTLRTETERPEAAASGVAQVVGVDTRRIIDAATSLLANGYRRTPPASGSCLFGDGHAASQIVEWMQEVFCGVKSGK